jgi:hypothetical protein
MWRRLKGNVPAKNQPTSYQIRYKGEQALQQDIPLTAL